MQLTIKNIAAIVVLLPLLLKIMALPIACFQYEWNKAFIAANLCENKDKPLMHCNGKCHLKKQMEKTGENPGSENEKTGSKAAVTDYLEHIPAYQFYTPVLFTQGFNSYFRLLFPEGYRLPAFRPPAFSLHSNFII